MTDRPLRQRGPSNIGQQESIGSNVERLCTWMVGNVDGDETNGLT